jgi:hypothetical protein
MSTINSNAGSAAVHDIGHWIDGQSLPVDCIKTSPVMPTAV